MRAGQRVQLTARARYAVCVLLSDNKTEPEARLADRYTS
jgi:hypothetical protein